MEVSSKPAGIAFLQDSQKHQLVRDVQAGNKVKTKLKKLLCQIDIRKLILLLLTD